MLRSVQGRMRALWGAAVLVMAACAGGADTPPPLPGSEILGTLAPGITKDEVIVALPRGPLAEDGAAIVHGYQQGQYLVNGVFVEVLWLRSEGYPGEAEDPRIEVNPVIFADGVFDGAGWEHFDARSTDWGALPLPSPPAS